MKVLKFGGSSLADAARYMRVFDISRATHDAQGAAVVLSAPKGVTNALSLLCEQAQSGKNYQELFAKLTMTFNGIAEELNAEIKGLDYQPLSEFIEQKLSLLAEQLKGIALLKTCPDQVTASILSMGEYISVRIFSEILTAKGINNAIIDPVDYVQASGEYLDSLAQLDISRAKFSDVDTSGTQLLIMPGFVAANEEPTGPGHTDQS